MLDETRREIDAVPLLPSELAWYVTGRFYVSEDGSILDVGYFLHLQGVSGSLCSGPPSEATAYFTFSSSPFRADRVTNGDLTLALDTVGDFILFLNRQPGATFEDPKSFSAGEPIARFRRTSMVVGTTVGGDGGGPGVVSLNVFSAALVWSQAFEHEGHTYDLRHLLPRGVTQWGTASTKAVAAPDGFTSVVPFVGSAVAIGGERGEGFPDPAESLR